MQRRELERAIKEYSNRTKFYKLGLVRKLIQWKEKEYKRLQDNIPKIVCPNCGSKRIVIDYSDDDYSNERYLTCWDCCENIKEEKEQEYLDAYYELVSFSYIDGIEMHIWGDNFKVTPSEEWNKFCEKEIKKIIGDK